MNRDELAHGFSDLLGLSIDSIFDEPGKDEDLKLSGWAVTELDKVITLPEGYELTKSIRVPDVGEFFLDVEALVAEERVVVYKATGSVSNSNLILTPTSTTTEIAKVEKFDFFLCMLQGGLAKYMDKVVRLLLPAVDKGGRVVVVYKGKFKLVELTSLSHVDSPSAMDNLDNLSLSEIHNKLKDIGWSTSGQKNNTPDDPYADRWGLKFD